MQQSSTTREFFAESSASVTPSNTDRFKRTKALWIGGAGSGNLTVVWPNGNTQAFAGVPAGEVQPMNVIGVMATGTDVTSIVALY